MMELKLPKLNKPGSGILKTDPESFRKWVGNLPLANIDACVGQLEFGLSEINGVEIPPANRLQILELLAGPVMHITGTLQKKLRAKHLPLGTDDLNKSDQSLGLFLALATGYKLLVAALAREANIGTRPVLPMLRAIGYLAEALIGSYQSYLPYREGIWADLHALYTLALKHRLQTHQEIDTTKQKPALMSIETAYKQILLLSLANPYRLRPGEIRQVYNLLESWAPYCEFQTAQEQDASGLFACHLSSDDPPRYLQLTRRELLDASWIILDTSAMTKPANATLGELRDKPDLRSVLPGENTLKRLMLSWGVMPERQGERRREEVPVQLVVGLSPIHRLLSDPAAKETAKTPLESTPAEAPDHWFDPTFEQPTLIATKGPPERNTTKPAEGRSNPFLPPGQFPLKGAYAPEKPPRPDGERQSPTIESWKMVDVSVGGYCLLWESDDVSSAQVGELVVIRTGSKASADSWKLGVIRWMKFTPRRGLVLGVQLLATGITPIRACLSQDKPAAETRSQGLLLAANTALKQPASLLLPSVPFRTGCLAMLTRGDQEDRIILLRELENTGSFAQFHFIVANGA